MVEVLTAVSLLGILTAVGATNFGAMRPAFETRGAALLIAGDINQARMSAIQQGRVYEFFPIAGGYRIRRDNGAGGLEVVKQRVLSNEYAHVTFGHSGITIDPYNITAGAALPAGTITFQSNGTVSNAASVYVEAPSGDDRVQQAVTLTAAGRVRVWKWSGGAWH